MGSFGSAGTFTASHADLTTSNSGQLPVDRFFAAVSVHVRYFGYELALVFIIIAP